MDTKDPLDEPLWRVFRDNGVTAPWGLRKTLKMHTPKLDMATAMRRLGIKVQRSPEKADRKMLLDFWVSSTDVEVAVYGLDPASRDALITEALARVLAHIVEHKAVRGGAYTATQDDFDKATVNCRLVATPTCRYAPALDFSANNARNFADELLVSKKSLKYYATYNGVMTPKAVADFFGVPETLAERQIRAVLR
jgi:hypothetical protein